MNIECIAKNCTSRVIMKEPKHAQGKYNTPCTPSIVFQMNWKLSF